ncbi:hypothetical protein GCM10027610_075650 [Dactylosporangium cerinum]
MPRRTRRRPGAPPLQAGPFQDLVHPAAGQALGVREPQQVVARGPPRLQRTRVQQRTEVTQGAAEAAVRPAPDQRGARVGCVEAENHPHRGGLAGAVGADESGDLAGFDGERHPVEGGLRPEPFAKSVDDNHGSCCTDGAVTPR